MNGAVARCFLWDVANLIAELDGAGAKVGEYALVIYSFDQSVRRLGVELLPVD